MNNAPATMNGMTKVFEEVFISPFEKETWADALNVLSAIRSAHDAYHGWIEIDSDIERLPNGKWRAIRHHAQYK